MHHPLIGGPSFHLISQPVALSFMASYSAHEFMLTDATFILFGLRQLHRNLASGALLEPSVASRPFGSSLLLYAAPV